MLGIRLALWTLVAALLLFLVVDWGTSVPTPRKCEQYDGDSREHGEIEQCTGLRSTVFEGAEPIVYRTARWFDVHNGTVTGVATVLLAIITAWLVFVARDQSKTTRAQLRAYVGVTTRNTPNLIVGENQMFGIFITNYGNTPALKVKDWGDIRIKEYPLRSELPALTFRNDMIPVNPQQKVPIEFQMIAALSASELANIRNDIQRMYVYGKIEYFDVFDEYRVTSYRFEYGGTRLIGMGQMAVSDEGNEQK